MPYEEAVPYQELLYATATTRSVGSVRDDAERRHEVSVLFAASNL
jgi:hypothetical protein